MTKMYKNKCSLLLLVIAFVSNSVISQTKEGEEMDKMWGESKTSSKALLLDKAKLFDESNYGMFIHWGLFSKLGGVWKDKTYYGIGEWIMNPRVANIPPVEYMKIANTFNPVQFDATKIAQLAKDAGMKYIIITSKHHEGFAMFKSNANKFNIVDATPFARDPMKELSAACHKLGLGFGFYYSHNQDWTAPGGTGGPKVDERGNEALFKDYFYNKCKPQVKEICSNYGQIDFVWFDTPGAMKKEYVIELVDLVKKLQPKAMMCSRVGHNLGDYASKGDMEVPTKNIEGLWETADTNNDSWSYAWYDNNFKSPKEIVHRVVETVARGGTYLFNIGLDGQGVVPSIGAQFLKESGAWIKKYPQVVYAAGSSPWGQALPWGDVTTKAKSLFLAVSKWPSNGKLYVPGLTQGIKSVKILKGDQATAISFEQKNKWTILNVPFEAPEELVSIIEVELNEDANQIKIDSTLGIMPNQETVLITEFSEVKNAKEESIRWMEKFGEWKHANQVSEWATNGTVTWKVNVQEPGYYYLDLSYKGKDRLVWKTVTDEGILVQNQQAATDKYVYYNMGIIEFKTVGIHTITVSLVDGDRKISSLKALKLKPIK